MNVSSWSIRNPIPSILLFVLLTVLGLMAFRGMKIQQFPDVDLPTVTVTASLPGAAPAQMETEVARKIENSVATLQGVKPVSYTHLDVFKRQTLMRYEPFNLLSQFQREVNRLLDASRFGDEETGHTLADWAPVSYTHLDVDKRQVISGAGIGVSARHLSPKLQLSGGLQRVLQRSGVAQPLDPQPFGFETGAAPLQ